MLNDLTDSWALCLRIGRRQAAIRPAPNESQAAVATSNSTPGGAGMPLHNQYSVTCEGLTPLGDGILLLHSPHEAERLRGLIMQALQDYSLHTPRPSNLHIIIRVNVLNAIADNAGLIGFPKESLCRDEFISPFYQIGPSRDSTPIPLPSCPMNLQPTILQRIISHHPWIDLFPVPNFRDNVLQGLQAGLFDDDDLCNDLLGVESTGVGEQPSLIVWTVTWDARGWEFNAAFLKKWGTLLEDCPEMLRSTNYWRAKRGQAALTLDTGPVVRLHPSTARGAY